MSGLKENDFVSNSLEVINQTLFASMNSKHIKAIKRDNISSEDRYYRMTLDTSAVNPQSVPPDRLNSITVSRNKTQF